jgi:hypothetical protein
MVSADAVFALVSVLLLVGMAGLMGAFLAGFRVPKMEGRPSKPPDPVMELEITGALCGAAAGAAILCVTSLMGWLNIAL